MLLSCQFSVYLSHISLCWSVVCDCGISWSTYHSTSSISIQPVEKITYHDNSSKRYRNILRHGLDLKWIKLLQTPHPLSFNDNIYHDGNISRLPDFDVCFFTLLDIRKRNK